MSFDLKDIHKDLCNLRAEGRSVDELEGLLVNSEDLTELLQSLPEYHTGMPNDGIKVFGVRIIESQYTQKGTILRIFRKDFGPTIGGSLEGVIYIPDDMKLQTITEKKKKPKLKHSNKRKIELD